MQKVCDVSSFKEGWFLVRFISRHIKNWPSTEIVMVCRLPNKCEIRVLSGVLEKEMNELLKLVSKGREEYGINSV